METAVNVTAAPTEVVAVVANIVDGASKLKVAVFKLDARVLDCSP